MDVDQHRVGDHDRDRSRLAGYRQGERITNRSGDLANVLDVENTFRDRLQ